jgi:hypothetical protein
MSNDTEALAIIFFTSAVMDAHCLSNALSKAFRAAFFSGTVQMIS